MQRQSSIDPLVSTIPAAAEAPTLEQSVNEPSSLSQSAAMRVVDAFAETLVIAALLGELGLGSAMFSHALISTTRFFGQTRSRGCHYRSWHLSAARSPIADAITRSFASCSISCRDR
jgi:hypothetical protein